MRPELHKRLFYLIEQGESDSLQLAGQLIKSLGYQIQHLQSFLKQQTLNFLNEFLPDLSYHRFGCSLTDPHTYKILLKKMQEFFLIQSLEVEVDSEQLFILATFIPPSGKEPLKIPLKIQIFTSTTYYEKCLNHESM